MMIRTVLFEKHVSEKERKILSLTEAYFKLLDRSRFFGLFLSLSHDIYRLLTLVFATISAYNVSCLWHTTILTQDKTSGF